MNRNKVSIIKETTNMKIDEINSIITCSPYSQGWRSEKFPVYPLVVNLYVENPPFNRVSLCSEGMFCPSKIQIQISESGTEFFSVCAIKLPVEDPTNIIINLKTTYNKKYLRMILHEPPEHKQNFCRQVAIRCIQLTFVTQFGFDYLCQLQPALIYDPFLFRLLELLEYKSFLCRKVKMMQISKACFEFIDQILQWVRKKKQNPYKLSQEGRKYMINELTKHSKDPIFEQQSFSQYDNVSVMRDIKKLQEDLSEFYLDRSNALQEDVKEYFREYWNVEIKEQYLRLLSSAQEQDHLKALTNFWAQAKTVENYSTKLEEAVIMFLNYFLEFLSENLKISASKILCLFFTKIQLSYDIPRVYQRLLFTLLDLANSTNKSVSDVCLKCIYILFERIPNRLFLSCLLAPERSREFDNKILRLQIMEKITFRNVHIQNRSSVINFLLDLLLMKQMTLAQKNKAYNIVAYLASLMGKEQVIANFQKLNSMLLLSMQKVIDSKISTIQAKNKSIVKLEEQPSCEFCGIVRDSFKDTNVYDLHLFKECKYMTPCQYCQKIVQIPELFKHYIHECEKRNRFKQCQNCNECILEDKEKQHKEVCQKVFYTKCPLCLQKFEGKLKLKEHILKDICPNNTR